MKAEVKKAVLFAWGAVDTVARAAGRGGDIPPLAVRSRNKKLTDLRRGRWLDLGQRIKDELQSFCALRPEHRVFELGCGAGIAAYALRGFLTSGRYLGVDVDGPSIEWCQRDFDPAQFRFELVDAHNETYNPNGSIDSAQTRLPAEKGAYDIGFAISVFTHMYPREIVHYLAEIRRIMAADGRFLATFLTMDRYREGISKLPLRYRVSEDCLGWDAETPTKAIAVSRPLIERMCATAELRVANMRPGNWDGVTNAPYVHDMYVFAPK